MDRDRNVKGFLNLNGLDLKFNDESLIYTFNDNDEKYYFKARELDMVYNELIAEELAHDYEIETIHYDIAKYKDEYGNLSKDFIKDKTFISMYKILLETYKETINTNNINDIWNALKTYKINNRNLTLIEIYNIVDKIADVFMFDLLLANRDRHAKNIGLLVDNDKVDLAPLFDNEQILNNYSIFNNIFLLGVDKKIDIDFPIINYFFKISDKKYLEKFKNKLSIIKEENIINVLKRIEDRINLKITDNIKTEKIERFKINQKKIINSLNI